MRMKILTGLDPADEKGSVLSLHLIIQGPSDVAISEEHIKGCPEKCKVTQRLILSHICITISDVTP